MFRISKKVIAEIKQMLPAVRQEVEDDFIKWNGFAPGKDFYSDEIMVEILPYAIFEYYLLKKGCHIDKRNIIWALNHGVVKNLKDKVAFALRHLALYTITEILHETENK